MKYSIFLSSVAMLALISTPAAYGQDATSGVGVPRLPKTLEVNTRPDALAKIIVGGSAGFTYSDNIYRAKTRKKSDLVAIVSPGITLRTDMEDRKAQLRASLTGGKYFNESKNNYVDADIQGNGRYILSPQFAVLGDAGLQYSHVDIGAFVDDSDRAADEPTIYRKSTAGIGGEWDNQAQYALLYSGLVHLDYDNTDSVGNGSINNQDRDHVRWENRLRVGQYIAPGTVVYGQGSVNVRDYRTKTDSTAFNGKNSAGYGLVAGLAKGTAGDPLWYEVNAGYIGQNYVSAFYPDVHTYGFEGRGKWWVIPNTLALKANAGRSVEENALAYASSHVMTSVGVGAEYALDPRWTLQGDTRYTLNDFQINPAAGQIGRRDVILDTSVQLDYNITGDYYAGVEYVHVNRNSDDNTLDYKTNSIIARLSLKY